MLLQWCVFFTHNHYKFRRVAIHGDQVRMNAHPTQTQTIGGVSTLFI